MFQEELLLNTYNHSFKVKRL